MQSVSSRIWTRVAVSISYDDNDYTTGTSIATGHLIAPGDHHTLQHIQVHFGVDFQADYEDVRWHDVALTWNHTKYHNRNRKLCFITLGTSLLFVAIQICILRVLAMVLLS